MGIDYSTTLVGSVYKQPNARAGWVRVPRPARDSSRALKMTSGLNCCVQDCAHWSRGGWVGELVRGCQHLLIRLLGCSLESNASDGALMSRAATGWLNTSSRSRRSHSAIARGEREGWKEGGRERGGWGVEKKGLGALRLLASSAADPLQATRVTIRRFLLSRRCHLHGCGVLHCLEFAVKMQKCRGGGENPTFPSLTPSLIEPSDREPTSCAITPNLVSCKARSHACSRSGYAASRLHAAAAVGLGKVIIKKEARQSVWQTF